MATLVLTAVGSAIGGPIGGAIGAFLGQQVDQNILFRPKGREGPRLQELSVQTSSYGSQVPRIHGRMRVAGTVVWATDLKETRSREGGGKGRPSTTVYSYSACFAVALSSRRIRDIGRIWADGKIFRGAAGDFKTGTGFAFHPGGEDQPVDGLIASAEAAGGTPAYRGLALAVFEDMDLTDYGNRIPSLTFEVIADDGSVALADIVADISGQRIALDSESRVTGFAAGGEDRQAALRALSESVPLSLASDPSAVDRLTGVVRIDSAAGPALAIGPDVAVAAGRQALAPPEQRTAAIAATARHHAIRYYDPARDYQSGIQSASRPGVGRLSVVRDFPAALDAGAARAIAASALWTGYDERATLQLAVPLDSRCYRPGMIVARDGADGLWRVRESEIGRGFVRLSLSRASGRLPLGPAETEEGRNVPDADLRAGSTRLVLADLPFAIDAPGAVAESARFYAAAAGDAGWRHADLFAAAADGQTGAFIGRIPAPTILGTAVTALGPAAASLIDQVSHVDVDLRHSAMVLTSADPAQLLAGRNIALVGRELIQFGRALPLEEGRYRLSWLIRGLGGTENEIAGHQASEDFVLLDGASMLAIGTAFHAPFARFDALALGRDDPAPVAATLESPGRALMPWSPVHPIWHFQDGGALAIGWTRRSRAGAIWPDHVEVPLAEEFERYRVELLPGSGSDPIVSREPVTPGVILSAEELAPLLSGNAGSISARIYQLGGSARSPALAFDIPL